MNFKVPRVEDYELLVGAETVERILAKAKRLAGFHVTHINSTYYGGGVAELLSTLTLLLNGLGIRAGWRVLQGAPDFFGITKNMHNALQGMPFEFTPLKQRIFEEIVFQNALRNHLDHDMVIVHDPQPLPLIAHYEKRSPWVWRCHIDMSNPHRDLWKYLSGFVARYDAAIFSIKEYSQTLPIPELFFLPAIDPFSTKNRELREETMTERMAHYEIPTDLPLVVQVSRFDPWKDPKGVIEAFKTPAAKCRPRWCCSATSLPTIPRAPRFTKTSANAARSES
jgi:trehalose synthase